MKKYGLEDLHIVNALEHVRRNPSMYLGGQGKVSGQSLAARLVFDVIDLGALPVDVRRAEDWWIISASLDWLYAAGSTPERLFHNVVPFPEAGDNSCRREILLTAFADAVVTCGPEGVRWLKGSPATAPLPADIDLQGAAPQGSVVAFRM